MKSQLFTTFILQSTLAWAQVIQLDIEKRPTGPRLIRRAGSTMEEIIENDVRGGGYFCTVSIGTPGQNLTLQLDTGSSDLWVPWSLAAICFDDEECDRGSFDPKASSTYIRTDSVFDITYADKDSSQGFYFLDQIEIGGQASFELTMGLGIDTDVPYGLAGVGYPKNEAWEREGGFDRTYPNLPVAMKNAGLISSIAYSLWLNDLGASQGSILFGGLDTEKFIGEMIWIDIIKEYDTYLEFSVPLTSMIASSPSGNDTLSAAMFPVPVVLDSGTTLSYLPQKLAEEAWTKVGAFWDASFGGAVIPCSYASQAGYLSFGFAGSSGPQINVTMDELVFPFEVPSPRFTSGRYKGQTSCFFGIQNDTVGTHVLGDTFLRSAYVVYDLDNNQIGLAATDFNATKSNVIPFSASKEGKPPSKEEPPNDDTPKDESSTGSFIKGPSLALMGVISLLFVLV